MSFYLTFILITFLFEISFKNTLKLRFSFYFCKCQLKYFKRLY